MRKSKYEQEYRPAQKILVVNDDDQDLVPISILPPKPPNIRTIKGYGLPPKDQMWERTVLPPRLRDLTKIIKKRTGITPSLPDYRTFLTLNKREFVEEIKFILEQWRRRMEGYWFFNNGVPTYINGWHYMYINWWQMKSEGPNAPYPEYRDRDRIFYLAVRYFYDQEEILGVNYPKHRREGATSKAEEIMFCIISMLPRVQHGGIQSMDEKSARNVFQRHMVPGWRGMPFFFKPIFEGYSNPKNNLSFSYPATKITKSNINTSATEDALDSWIDYGPAEENHFDGQRLDFFHNDEVGKTKQADVKKRHVVIKRSITLGGLRVGFCLNTSTVGLMDKDGGQNFKDLCKQSHFHERNENNQTTSGLVNLFIPADIGFENFIDEYGNSDRKGARAWILNELKSLEEDGDYAGYAETFRQMPLKFRNCFISATQGAHFNMAKLLRRMADFNFGNKFVTRGNFVRIEGPDSEVIWEPSENGKFKVSWLYPDQSLSNQSIMQEGVRVPKNINLFIAGGDPYKFKITKGSRNSDGAGTVFMKHNPAMDPGEDISEWKSNLFVCTYSNRPDTKEEFGEDMLMMCIYYGCYMFTESNVPDLWDYFERRGYIGYLYYQTGKDGKLSKTPGAHTGSVMQQAIFREWHTYIERHCEREVHDELLEQCSKIEDSTTDYDLFVAGGYALIADSGSMESVEEPSVKLDRFFRTFEYK